MNMKHTPGPWRVGEYIAPDLTDSWVDGDVRLYERAIYGKDQVKIAVCEQWIGDSEEDEAEANARLIAAAPDLLSMLQEWIQLEEEYGDPANVAINDMWERAKRLVALAKGEA